MQGTAENLLSMASGTTQAAATSLGLQSQVVLVLVGLIGYVRHLYIYSVASSMATGPNVINQTWS